MIKKPKAKTARKPKPKPKPSRTKPGTSRAKKPVRPLRKRPAPKPRATASSAAPEENPRAKAIAQRVAAAALDKKATDVVILDVRGKTSYADYVVLASGDSERQVLAMADNVLDQMKLDGKGPLGTEGLETGNWALLDFGEVVAHLFFADVRAFYDLEGLWSDAPKEKVA